MEEQCWQSPFEGAAERLKRMSSAVSERRNERRSCMERPRWRLVLVLVLMGGCEIVDQDSDNNVSAQRVSSLESKERTT